MTDKAAIPDAWRPFGKPRGTRDPELNLDARAQAFLDRIAPLSADLAAHGRTRALALKKLRRICQAEVRRLKANFTLATSRLVADVFGGRGPTIPLGADLSLFARTLSRATHVPPKGLFLLQFFCSLFLISWHEKRHAKTGRPEGIAAQHQGVRGPCCDRGRNLQCCSFCD